MKRSGFSELFCGCALKWHNLDVVLQHNIKDNSYANSKFKNQNVSFRYLFNR